MNKKNFLIIALILVVINIIYMYPKEIHKEFDTVTFVHWDKEKEVIHESFIIDGWLYKNFFMENSLKAQFKFGDLNFLNNAGKYKLNTLSSHGEAVFVVSSDGYAKTYGTVYISKDLKSVMLFVHKDHGNGAGSFSNDEGMIVAGPASSKKEAIGIVESMIKNTLFKNLIIEH